ncbi:MAG: sugar phosphate isomerase/epimerase family protein [Gaiellaceae bacterium]
MRRDRLGARLNVTFGVCTWVWAAPLGDADVLPIAERVRDLGFDVLEVCIEDPDLVSLDALVKAREQTGLAFSVCGAFGPDRDLAHHDARPRANASGYLDRLLELAAAVGSPHVCGPMYSAVGKEAAADGEARKVEWDRAVTGLTAAAARAEALGVRLAIEPLNRFETDLVNTTEQGLALCADIGSPAAGLLLDTFHMNIEEKSVGDAIRMAGDRLFHVHACENDRGTLGTAHVPWNDVFSALREIDYDGQIVIESFTPAVTTIARAVAMWRPLDDTGDALATAGLAFLRQSAA